MNGYLMQDKRLVRGEDTFIESFSQENRYGVVFEDDGETGYFYAVERDEEGQGLRVLDALHIYEVEGAADGVAGPAGGEGAIGGAANVASEGAAAAGGDVTEPVGKPVGGAADVTGAVGKPAGGAGTDERPESKLLIVWSRDWEKCALVIDGFCHAIYDFKARGGYNIN
jgi:hypothetical protein